MHMEVKDLWQHQKDAIKRAQEFDYFALFFDPGTGKTATTVNILRDKFNKHKRVLPTLILAPPVVLTNWKNEIQMWSKVKKEKIHVLSGSGKERVQIINELTPDNILITNYEALNMPLVFEALKKFLKQDTSCLVLDESHKIKDSTAKRTKRAIELSDITTYRYLLTGTPILNNLMDIYSQFRVLDRGERFGSNFFTFRARYFEDKNKFMPRERHFPNWQPIRGADQRIKELIMPVSMHVEKSQCLDLPPLVRKVISVPLSPEQKRLYDEMKRDLVASITLDGVGERHSIAELAVTKALRLQQIVSGHLRIQDEETNEASTILIKDNPRKEALRELLENLAPNHKVLIWAVFHANYDDIRAVCEGLQIGYVEINGLVKDKDAQAHKFRTDDKVRVLIGHPGSGGIGLNLVEASYMIYYSRSFSLEYDIQSEARNYRGGSEKHESITRIDLVTHASIDELVFKALASKQAISHSVLKENLESL